MAITTLTVDDAGISDHPVNVPLVPIGADLMIYFRSEPEGFDSETYFFTVTGYDVHIEASTGEVIKVAIFAGVSDRNDGDLVKLRKYWHEKQFGSEPEG